MNPSKENFMQRSIIHVWLSQMGLIADGLVNYYLSLKLPKYFPFFIFMKFWTLAMYKATRLDLILLKISKDLRLGQTLREKCPYSEFFRSLFSRIRIDTDSTPYLSVFSPNAGKYRPEKNKIRTLFTQWKTLEDSYFPYWNKEWFKLSEDVWSMESAKIIQKNNSGFY